MAIVVRKKEDENVNTLIYRFNKKVMQSGILKEARKRLYKDRNINKRRKRISAIYRYNKTKEIERKKKLGLI